MFRENIDECLASDLVLLISFDAVNIKDLLRLMVFDQMDRQFSYTLIILRLDAGHLRDINFKRDHGNALSLETGTDSFLLMRKIKGIRQHDRPVKIVRIRKMEKVQLALVLQFMIVDRAVRNKHKNIHAIFSGFLLQSGNYMLDEFVAVSIRKYRYPMVHVLILRTKSVFARSFCSDFTQPETDSLYHELLSFSVI